MKILIANYRYYVSSGPERYMFSVIDALNARRHEVIPFSIKYSRNVQTPYSQYFVRPLGTQDEVYFNEHRNSAGALLTTLSRLIYSKEVESAVIRMVAETHPDIAYVLCYLRKLSPSLLVGLKRKKLPIAVRLSDFGMLCPEHHFLRNSMPCTLCLEGNLIHSIVNRCVKRSIAISALDALATWFHRFKKYFDCIDAFITTNQFMSEMMVSAGYAQERIHCIPTFTDVEVFKPSSSPTQPVKYIVYVGRLDRPKGVHILIEATGRLKSNGLMDGLKVKLAGSGHDEEYVASLHKAARDYQVTDVIEFLGDLDSTAVPSLLSDAIFAVVPSVWYENLPNTLLESLACGTPVVASNIGSLTAAIRNEVDGLLFEPGSADDLAAKMEKLISNEILREEMSRSSRNRAVTEFSPDAHLNKLIGLFRNLVINSRQS